MGNIMKKLIESFEWIDLENPPKDRLLKVIAKTTETTLHPEDKDYPVRLFAEANLMRNANLVGRPVGLNHGKLPIFGAYVVDSEYNEEEKQLEALLFVPPEYVEKAREGLISNVSVEYTWRKEKKTKKGTEFSGMNITRIDLVEGLKAGDSGAVVTLFEAKKKTGTMLMEIEKPEKLGEPFADYEDMDACIAANQDKEDPAAYCASIKAKTEQEHDCPEGEEWSEEEQKCVPKKAEETHDCPEGEVWSEEEQKCVKKAEEQAGEDPEKCPEGEVWDEEQKKCVPKPKEPSAEELKEALQRVMKIHKELKESVDKNLKEAVAEAKEEILKLVEAKIPNSMYTSRYSHGAKRLVWELKKTIREAREEE